MYSQNLSALSPENYPFSLEFLPPEACMVGGAVRDALLGRTREYLDLDFVISSGAVQVARKIAKHYKAGFVLLDAQRQIARVVFPGATADFAQQEGESLEVDLHRRDFTVNAIAYNPRTNQLIDPLQGCADLHQQTMRMISPKNLQNDPLRLLRAYRQAAQLGFKLDTATQATIRELSPLLTQVAAERVRVELGYLLATAAGTPRLKTAWEDGLISLWFKNVTLDSFTHLTATDTAAITLTDTHPQLATQLNQPIRDTIKTTWLGIAKLACFVTPIPEAAEQELLELSYSRAETRSVTTILKLLPQLQEFATNPSLLVERGAIGGKGLLREQYFFFREAQEVLPAVAAYGLAHGIPADCITPLINRYLNPEDIIAHPQPLVTGKDIMQALNLPPSPLIGKLITEVAVAQIQGKISTSPEAIKFASQILDTL